MPDFSASARHSGVTSAVRPTMGMSGRSCRRAAVVWQPSMMGMWKSMNVRSGSREASAASMKATASGPLSK